MPRDAALTYRRVVDAYISGTLTETIAAVAQRHGDDTYLIGYDEDGARTTSTFRAFFDRASRLGSLFQERGLELGDRVAIVAENRPEVLVAYFACWLAGLTACPINVSETRERKIRILAQAGCRLVLAEASHRAEAEALAQRAQAVVGVLTLDDLEAHIAGFDPIEPEPLPLETGGFLIFTSGTTGRPKGVLLDHENLLTNAAATAAWHDLQPGDGVMTVLPIHHVNGAIVTGLTPWLAGGRNILNRRFSPSAFWRRLADEGAAMASMVPTLLEFLLAADADLDGYDLQRLRYLLCGAGPLLAETVTRFEDRFGVPICHGFGMSETTAYNTQFPMDVPDDERRSWYTRYGFPSVGCAIACNDVAILRDDGTRADPLERGQIAIRGPAVMDGYLDDPEANAESFTGDWFLSGDQGFFDVDEGGREFFFLSGRLKEIIVRGGVNIAPLEIDEVLRGFPGVQFALAVGFENVFYGEEIAAYVVPADGATLDVDALQRHAREQLGHAKAPKVIVTGADVPFTTTGKPKRVALAAQLAEELRGYRDVQFRDADSG